MKMWPLTPDVDSVPRDVGAIHDLIHADFLARGERAPRILGVATCETTADEYIYETYFELAPGVVLSTTFGSVADIQGSEAPTGLEARVAEEAVSSVRFHLAHGEQCLADLLHDLRRRARVMLATVSGEGGGASLIDIRLTTKASQGPGEFSVVVRLDGLDDQLRMTVQDVRIVDLVTFDVLVRAWATVMADRYAGHRMLALEGASGSIDLLTLNAISMIADPAAWLRALGSAEPPPQPDQLAIFVKNGAYHSEGSDPRTGLSWNRDTLEYPMLLPDTVLLACTGRPVIDLIEHSMLSSEMTIVEASCTLDDTGPRLTVEIRQPRLLFCSGSGRTWREGRTDAD